MLYYTTFYEITHRPLHIRILYHCFFFFFFKVTVLPARHAQTNVIIFLFFILFHCSNASSQSFLFMMCFHFFPLVNSHKGTVPLSMLPPPFVVIMWQLHALGPYAGSATWHRHRATLDSTIREERGLSRYPLFHSLTLPRSFFFSSPFSFSSLPFLLSFFFRIILPVSALVVGETCIDEHCYFLILLYSFRCSNASSQSFSFMMCFCFFPLVNSHKGVVPLSMLPPPFVIIQWRQGPLSPSFFLSFLFAPL